MTQGALWKLSAALSLIAIAIAGMLLGVWLHRRQGVVTPPSVKVVFLDISEGDCTIIQTPDNHTILIDTGSQNSGPEVVKALHAMGVERIDLLVLASPSDMGSGGILSLSDSGIHINSVWNNAVVNDEEYRRRGIAKIKAQHIPYRILHGFEREHIGSSKMVLTAVWPPQHGPRFQQDALVCRLDFGDTSFLFAGALAGSAEPFLITGSPDKLHCDILQVVDHGADTGSSLEMLRRAAPSTAVISCNPATPPSPAALHRLQAAGAGIWRTDMQGTVTVIADGKTSPMVAGALQ